MTKFWLARNGLGNYVIGSGDEEIVTVKYTNDMLAHQWARCCRDALVARERDLHNAAMANKWDAHADHDCLPDRYEE